MARKLGVAEQAKTETHGGINLKHNLASGQLRIFIWATLNGHRELLPNKI
jgi:hypothetical protein